MNPQSDCSNHDCGCNPSLARRDFLKLIGVSGAGALAGGGYFMSGESAVAADFAYSLIPANKNLDPAWVASLFARGVPTVYTGSATLAHVGMPVGGICCGQLYLAGDGRLWYWDIFNSPNSSMVGGGGGPHYATPLTSALTAVSQGFALQVGTGAAAKYFKLDSTGFANVTFQGQYPVGTVNYTDPACPVAVKLDAFSPFIPLNADDSGIPATVMEFTLTNTSAAPVTVEIAGWLQNMVCGFTTGVDGILNNHAAFATGHTRMDATVTPGTATAPIVYDDFERTTYAPWVAAGTAFGSGPVDTTNYPSSSYQTLAGFHGRYVVNSHASAPGSSIAARDGATGTLTSPTFTLNYNQINFLLSGGNHPGQTCFNLCRASDNSVLITSTGANSNTYTQQTWDVSAWVGQQVYFQVVDNYTGGWGNIGVDYITFANVQADIVFDDFERTTYAPWVAAGTAFGSGPVDTTNYPSSIYQTLSGYHGRYVINSHASAPPQTPSTAATQSADNTTRDSATGTLTSPTFTISRNFINFLICGGNHAGQTCMNLIVGGQVVLTATGSNTSTYTQASWDVRPWAGQTAYLQIVDNYTGGWGNIGIDYIVFSDTPPGGWMQVSNAADYGSMSLSLLNPQPGDQVSLNAPVDTLAHLFTALAANSTADATQVLNQQSTPLMGALGRTLTLAPGASATIPFVISWFFPSTLNNNATFNSSGWTSIQNITTLQKYYATRFANAGAVAAYVATNYTSLAAQTRLWRDTWYNSTLPYWFLDRTFANTSTLATSTSNRFSSGRFWGWEGTYCCAGTCTHVWQYAQAMARIFPAIESDTRQRVDYGIGFNATTGLIGYRAENGMSSAVDGQAGTILRTYREHQMSANSTFLTTNWVNVKKAMQYLLTNFDSNSDGILEGAQSNTLDAAWYGKISWLSGLYVAACYACQQMALEMGDTTFAAQLGTIAQSGANYIKNNLFYNSSYFIQLPDSTSDTKNIGALYGCEIDQVLGQSWAFQVGLGQILDTAKTATALAHLWTYNFAPDAGGFRTNPLNPISGGRVYAQSGESGLVMSTFPDPAHPSPSSGVVAGYFNECMSGFEHEVASHMIWAGMLQDGLAITRAIHDRYSATKRNPYNEIECSDHYARAMASYGIFIAMCGFEYHGPKGYIAFSPKLTPQNFQAAFTSAAGWGSFNQQRTNVSQTHTITLLQGQLTLNTLAFDLAPGGQSTGLLVTLNGATVSASMSQSGARVTVTLGGSTTIPTGQSLVVQITGTNLQDPAWVFPVTQVKPVSNGMQFAWTSVPGRTYTIQYTTSLSPASWITLQTGVPAAATGSSTTFTDATLAGASQRYYRVLIESQ